MLCDRLIFVCGRGGNSFVMNEKVRKERRVGFRPDEREEGRQGWSYARV